MALPLDIREMLRSATQFRAEREESIRLAVLVEVDAPEPLVAVVRDRLLPRTAAATLQIEVVEPGSDLAVDPGVDAAIVLVGSAGPEIVRILGDLVRKGTPAAALVQNERTDELARLLGVARDNVVGDRDSVLAVDVYLGRWLAERLAHRRLALANNFAFVRREVADEFVKATAWQNGVIGTVAFIPGADLPLMTANQMKMLLQIASAYGADLGVERVKELALVVGGGFGLRAVARQVVAIVPGFGWAVKGGIGYAGTVAMGKAAIEYFERGADLGEVAKGLRESSERIAAETAWRARRLRGGRSGSDGDATGA